MCVRVRMRVFFIRHQSYWIRLAEIINKKSEDRNRVKDCWSLVLRWIARTTCRVRVQATRECECSVNLYSKKNIVIKATRFIFFCSRLISKSISSELRGAANQISISILLLETLISWGSFTEVPMATWPPKCYPKVPATIPRPIGSVSAVCSTNCSRDTHRSANTRLRTSTKSIGWRLLW